jgi:ABC-type multidrug transport system ATPase subunit
MKRRLAVANAFIGNPRLVLLDEPSTGLDPESRRQLWYAVRAAKPGKCIVLTTHALDEAEMLCDRVAIMARGQVRTIGSPAQLRVRFDQGYKFMMTVAPANEARADEFVRSLLPSLVFRDAINGVRSYQLPLGADVAAIFKELEARRDELGIQNWGLSHTTLEEVFLRLVAETEAAARLATPRTEPDAKDGTDAKDGAKAKAIERIDV